MLIKLKKRIYQEYADKQGYVSLPDIIRLIDQEIVDNKLHEYFSSEEFDVNQYLQDKYYATASAKEIKLKIENSKRKVQDIQGYGVKL